MRSAERRAQRRAERRGHRQGTGRTVALTKRSLNQHVTDAEWSDRQVESCGHYLRAHFVHRERGEQRLIEIVLQDGMLAAGTLLHHRPRGLFTIRSHEIHHVHRSAWTAEPLYFVP